ncbi:alanine--tRNA ligase [symbiont of Argiope bruennichi]|uniref:alanine--tRNA ligase n=1 Tax=symbiont of Argiope bruennichi TaxID=2810479 RepID=UPI003DA4FD2C
MKYLTSSEICEKFLNFFKNLNHEILPSFSLIPQNDNSILYVNAGITPIKNYFTGIEIPTSKRIAFCQKVIRTNDLDEIGSSGFHLSFFEMLGNFSIGNYFKKHAIYFAFKFLTDKNYLAIDENRLYVTVLEEDKEAFKEWSSYLKDDHIILATKKTNFWDLKKGPCGSCTEIFFDLAPETKEKPSILRKGEKSERFLEIWNIVFSEFNNDGFNNYYPLNQKNIDTGAGLERLCVVLQNKKNVFETDVFLPLIKIIEKKSFLKFDEKNLKIKKIYWIILDHTRTITFLINEKISCSGKGRGYILNKLIKRVQLMLVDLSIDLIQEQEKILKLLVTEIYKIYQKRYDFEFSILEVVKIIINAFEKFKVIITKTQALISFYQKNNQKIDHNLAFKLHDTFGFPVEELKNLFFDLNININWNNFQKLVTDHILLSKKHKNFTTGMDIPPDIVYFLKKYQFQSFHNETFLEDSKLILLFNSNFEPVEFLEQNDFGYAIFEKTCFYPESGGQIFDTGIIFDAKSKIEVTNVQKWFFNSVIHQVKIVKNNLFQKKTYKMRINYERRDAITKNHSSTHVINHFLLKDISKKIYQNGSYIDENKLKFDFFSDVLIKKDKIALLNKKINNFIKEDHELKIYFEDYDNLKNNEKIVKNFPLKYDKKVRVVNFGKNISELCSGTHVKNLNEIENIFIYDFKKTGESNYRIMATSSKKYSKIIFDTMKANLINKYQKLNSLYLEMPEKLQETFLKTNSLLEIKEEIDALKDFDYQSKLKEKEIDDKILVSMKKIKKILENVSSQLNYKEPEMMTYFYENCLLYDQNNLKILVSKTANSNYKLIKKFLNQEINNFDLIIVNNLVTDKWQIFFYFSSKKTSNLDEFKKKLIKLWKNDLKHELKIKDNFGLICVSKEENDLFFSLLKVII